jgi:NADP-dependent 3-hydroxy acid dehydrogenase YdfG
MITPEGGLTGTVALITGASSGIGRATAHALAPHGGTLVLVARRRDRLSELAAELGREHATSTLVIEADITDREQALAAVARTVDELGRIDIVINNAGVMLNGSAVSAPLEEWERMVALNVSAMLYVTHAALPHLLAAAESEPRRVADLVNLSSIAGRKANAGSAVYNLTKFGVNAFSEGLRQEVTAKGLRVALVEPGATQTELFDHNRDEIKDMMRDRLGGFEHLQASDIAEAIEYIVTRPRRATVNEVLVRPTPQTL